MDNKIVFREDAVENAICTVDEFADAFRKAKVLERIDGIDESDGGVCVVEGYRLDGVYYITSIDFISTNNHGKS